MGGACDNHSGWKSETAYFQTQLLFCRDYKKRSAWIICIHFGHVYSNTMYCKCILHNRLLFSLDCNCLSQFTFPLCIYSIGFFMYKFLSHLFSHCEATFFPSETNYSCCVTSLNNTQAKDRWTISHARLQDIYFVLKITFFELPQPIFLTYPTSQNCFFLNYCNLIFLLPQLNICSYRNYQYLFMLTNILTVTLLYF